MEDKDSGPRTTPRMLGVTALWRALLIWRLFMQPAIVWFGGAIPRRPPHRQPPPLRAHSCGGGRPAGVWWWDHGQRRGSDGCHALVPVLGQRDQEGEDRGADENRMGHGGQRSKRRGNQGRREQMEAGMGDARAMHARCKGAAPAMRRGPRAPYPGSHMDQELTSGGKGGGRRRTMRLCSLTTYCRGQGWLTKARYRQEGK